MPGKRVKTVLQMTKLTYSSSIICWWRNEQCRVPKIQYFCGPWAWIAASSFKIAVTLIFSFRTFCWGSPTRTSLFIGILVFGSNSPRSLKLVRSWTIGEEMFSSTFSKFGEFMWSLVGIVRRCENEADRRPAINLLLPPLLWKVDMPFDRQKDADASGRHRTISKTFIFRMILQDVYYT